VRALWFLKRSCVGRGAEEQREEKEKQGKAARWWLNRLAGKGWGSWRQYVAKKKHYKGIMQRWKSPHMVRVPHPSTLPALMSWEEGLASWELGYGLF
jgi:hypothetical protein